MDKVESRVDFWRFQKAKIGLQIVNQKGCHYMVITNQHIFVFNMIEKGDKCKATMELSAPLD